MLTALTFTALTFSNVAGPSIRQYHIFNGRQCSLGTSKSPSIPQFCFSSSFVRSPSTTSSTLNTNSSRGRLHSISFHIENEHDVKTQPFEPSRAAQPANKEQLPNNRFNWYNQWYPVSLIADLDVRKPNAFHILGTNIVVWSVPQKGQDSWAVFYDRCPHRFAALSEGRIDPTTRSLECGYHGWQFNSKGECTSVPQSEKPIMACAKALPSISQSGLLFVWMGSSTPPPGSGPAFIDDVRAKYITSAYSRILPLCFTTLFQNVLDPAHIHFAHHGQIGRRELAAPIPVRILRPQTVQGFTADYYDGSVRLRYRPPCLIEIVTSSGLSFAYYAVPIASGLVRTFALRGTSRRPFFRVPSWLDHIQRNRLVEGDLELMMTQQREMRKVSRTKDYAGSWGGFYMPTSSDRLIVEMKRWLDENAPTESYDWFTFSDEEHIGYKPRLASHTKECSSCSKIRKRVALLERIAAILAACAISCGIIMSDELQSVLTSIVGFSGFIFVVSRGLRKRLE